MPDSDPPGIAQDPSTGSLNDGTSARQPGRKPGIVIGLSDTLFALKSKRGRFDFDQALFSTTVELIRNQNSTLHNFGTLLVSKMREIEREGTTYYWAMRQKGISAADAILRDEYAAYKKRPFVRMGDFSDDTAVGKKNKSAGDFDQLSKPEGTTNCSTAVLDALYRALGGQVNAKGKVIKVGVVNGVPLSDASFSGFPKKFQGPDWDDAIVGYGLGYKVDMKDLEHGDIISMPGHRMIYLETIETRNGAPFKIKTIESKPPSGNTITSKNRKIGKNWKAARIFDIRGN